MAEQERKHRQEQSDAVESTEVEADAEASGSELTDKIDDILDELVVSGHLADGFKAEIPTFELGGAARVVSAR